MHQFKLPTHGKHNNLLKLNWTLNIVVTVLAVENHDNLNINTLFQL